MPSLVEGHFTMEEKTEFKRCYNDAIKLISRRDYSSYKITQKLLSKNYDQSTIDETIDKLVDQNYLREEEYKRIRIKILLTKGHSNSYIKQKCDQEKLKVADEDIQVIKDLYEFNDQKMIEELILKKTRYVDIPLGHEQKQKLKNKVCRFLISKGYRYDQFKDRVENHFKS